jgi:hypothetical protein
MQKKEMRKCFELTVNSQRYQMDFELADSLFYQTGTQLFLTHSLDEFVFYVLCANLSQSLSISPSDISPTIGGGRLFALDFVSKTVSPVSPLVSCLFRSLFFFFFFFFPFGFLFLECSCKQDPSFCGKRHKLQRSPL